MMNIMSSALSTNTIYFALFAHDLILDCGCGVGFFREILESLGEVVGIDISKRNLELSGYRNRVLCSATHLPFKDRCFDFVWACAVIEHVKEDCIPEISRVGNQTVFLTPNPNSPLNLLNTLLNRGGWFKNYPGHVHAYSIKELKKYGRVYGGSCGLPLRSFWQRIFPDLFWLLFPSFCHTIFLVTISP
jgi:SAM-dependent methyltransferase